MTKNNILELYDNPPDWKGVILYSLVGITMCVLSLSLLIALFLHEYNFFEISIGIAMVLWFGLIGAGAVSKAHENRAHVGEDRKLRYIFENAGLTDHLTSQKFVWDDFIATEGSSKNGLKFILKIPPKTIWLSFEFSQKQRKEVVGFLKANAPHKMTVRLWQDF